MSTERWNAHSLVPSMGEELVWLLLGLPLLSLLVAVVDGAEAAGFALVGLVTAVSIPAAIWVRRERNNPVVITIDGEWLLLTRGVEQHRHRLARGSLHASPWKMHGYGSVGTVLFMRTEQGPVKTIAVKSLLPDDRYAEDLAQSADLFLDRERSPELLERLRPYVMPRDPGTEPMDLSFSIPLHPFSYVGLPTQPARCLYIVNDKLSLGEAASTQLVTAQVNTPALEVQSYVYDHFASEEPPRFCLRLRFTKYDLALTLCGHSRPPRGLPKGERPTYRIGEAEFDTLTRMLGLA